jgi:predicted MFS family arabinose efflux permease
VIATISVASTVGIGVAYPLMGLLDQLAGLRVAYATGFLLSLIAVVIAWRTLPKDAPRPAPRIDLVGVVLLGTGTLGVLLAVAQPAVWRAPWIGASLLAVAALTLGVWAVVERRTSAPLVDLRLIAAGGVLRANVAMLVAGVGMYLLFSLLTRYVQTPSDAGYGFGLSGVLAGAALIPFSALGFVAGRLTPRLAVRLSARGAFAIAAVSVVIAGVLFALVPGSLVVTLAAMALLGFGVGGASAIMPRLVLDGVPAQETASVLSFNQIVRTVGFSIGSALAGLLLATATPARALLPREQGYTLAALAVLPLLVLAAALVPGVLRGARRDP